MGGHVRQPEKGELNDRLVLSLSTCAQGLPNLWSGDEEARQVVEQLNRDAGYEPLYAGPLENAAAQENVLKVVIAISQGGMGPFFYRIAPPDQL